ncbi:hypothetical protein C8R44DRAFT_322986 [Mycena epipterygia]|nr:hypothetical protein C8R44DRAFT_322986 [Mycena epipterygia]
MSSQPPQNPAAAAGPATTGTTSRPLGSSAESETDWLANSLLTAKIITAAADSVPLPYVKGVFGTVVVLLETVEKLKKNRDDLKELCEDIMKIISVVRRLSAQPDTPVSEFKTQCEEFEDALQSIVTAVNKMQAKPKGFRGHLKEFVRLGSTTDAISGYRKRMQELRSNFTLMAAADTNFQVYKDHETNIDTNLHVHQMHKTLATMTLTVPLPQVTQVANNCPPPSRIFEGRRAILDGMHQYFLQPTGKQHIYLLHGLGGAGKTQIALKFIEDSSSHFSNTFFIDTSTVETIDTGLKNIALANNAGSTSQDALEWLRNKPDEWLLFFDNADDPKLNLNKFLPRCNHGNIVITSRNPELRGYAGAHHLVSDMEETDAVLLLLKSAAQDATPQNEQTAAAIVKVLWYLPLAIIQAGAFILKSGALNTYLALYATNKERLLREKPTQSHDDYAWTVYTTWQISFDRLSKPAATLLQLCSFLHREGISEKIFSYASAYPFYTNGPSKEELQKPLEFLSQFLAPTGVWESLHFMDVITEIRAYSLINLDEMKQLFSIHPLVHDWSRTTLTDKELHHHCMVAIMGMSIAKMPRGNMTVDSLRLLPHLDALLNGNMHVVTPNFEAEYGVIYHYAQRYRPAEMLVTAVFEKQRMILGENHPDTLTAMHNLADTYFSLGKLEEAEKLQVAVVEKRKTVLGEDHPDTLIIMHNLASTYSALGKLEEAEKLQVVVLEKQKTVLGEDHPDTPTAMNNLATTYHALGKLEEAEKLQVVVVEKQKAVLGEDHPDTLITMHNLADTYHALGKLEEAGKLQVVVVEKRKTVLGEDHPNTLNTMHSLALTYHALGKLEEAEKLQVAVVEKRKIVLGEDHPHTLITMHLLAHIYYDVGKLEEAEKLQVVVVEKRKTVLGEDHPNTLNTMHSLALTYHALGKLEEAEKLQINLLKKDQKIHGEDHPDTLTNMHNLAKTYHVMGKLEEAEKLQVVVVKKRKTVLGEDHPHTQRSMQRLALISEALEKSKAEEAENTSNNQ